MKYPLGIRFSELLSQAILLLQTKDTEGHFGSRTYALPRPPPHNPLQHKDRECVQKKNKKKQKKKKQAYRTVVRPLRHHSLCLKSLEMPRKARATRAL